MNEQKNKWDLIKEFLWKHWVVIFIAAIVVIPILLNWLIRWPSFFEFVGKDTDWLMFWVTYISAIASFAMVFITWRTLQQNKEQFKEMKKQWDAEKNPNLILSLGIHQKCLFLKISNIGFSPAYNINLSINDSFYQALPNNVTKDCFNQLIEPFFIDGKSTKYVFIGHGDDLKTYLKDKNIIVSGTYCESNKVYFSCNMNEIIGKKFARITDDITFAVENIEKSVSSANTITKYRTIQQSLDIISKSIEEYMNNKPANDIKSME